MWLNYRLFFDIFFNHWWRREMYKMVTSTRQLPPCGCNSYNYRVAILMPRPPIASVRSVTEELFYAAQLVAMAMLNVIDGWDRSIYSHLSTHKHVETYINNCNICGQWFNTWCQMEITIHTLQSPLIVALSKITFHFANSTMQITINDNTYTYINIIVSVENIGLEL